MEEDGEEDEFYDEEGEEEVDDYYLPPPPAPKKHVDKTVNPFHYSERVSQTPTFKTKVRCIVIRNNPPPSR